MLLQAMEFTLIWASWTTMANWLAWPRKKLNNWRVGHGVELVEGKRNVTDFALWKFERPGENRAMVWKPLGQQGVSRLAYRCSAMSMEYLGWPIWYSHGGIDHIDIHHTNEIAQSEAATVKFLSSNIGCITTTSESKTKKMSKSLGNFSPSMMSKSGASHHKRSTVLGFSLSQWVEFYLGFVAAQKAGDDSFGCWLTWNRSAYHEFSAQWLRSTLTNFGQPCAMISIRPKAMAVFWNVTKASSAQRNEFAAGFWSSWSYLG